MKNVQDRLTVSPDMYPSLRVATRKIFQDGGMGAFYAGISPTLIGMLPYSTSYYFIYETAKKSYCSAKKKKSLNRPEMLLIGALAGEKLHVILLLISSCELLLECLLWDFDGRQVLRRAQ